jgi:hypothetical protein
VTVNDLWNIIPTNPPVSTVELTGAEIWEMMEDNLERTFAADPFNQMGGYLKRFRGLTIYGKLENPPGHRVERIFSGGVAPRRASDLSRGLRHRSRRAKKIRSESERPSDQSHRRVAPTLSSAGGHNRGTWTLYCCLRISSSEHIGAKAAATMK